MYSADVRKIATRLYSNCISLRKVASIIGSSHSSIYRWLNYVPEQRKARERKLENSKVLDMMKLYIKTHPFCSVKDLRSVLFETFELKVSDELVRLTISKTLLFTKKRARCKYINEVIGTQRTRAIANATKNGHTEVVEYLTSHLQN